VSDPVNLRHTIVFLEDNPDEVADEAALLESTYGAEVWVFVRIGQMVDFLLHNHSRWPQRRYCIVLDWFLDDACNVSVTQEYLPDFDDEPFLRAQPHIVLTKYKSRIESDAMGLGWTALQKAFGGTDPGAAASNAERIWRVYREQLEDYETRHAAVWAKLGQAERALPVLRACCERLEQDMLRCGHRSIAGRKANCKKFGKLYVKVDEAATGKSVDEWLEELNRVSDAVRARVLCFDIEERNRVADHLKALPSFEDDVDLGDHPLRVVEAEELGVEEARASGYYGLNFQMLLHVPSMLPGEAGEDTRCEIQVMTEYHEIWSEASHECYDAREHLLAASDLPDDLRNEIEEVDAAFKAEAENLQDADIKHLDARLRWAQLKERLQKRGFIPF
jgi:ppGpp synthetase/RelA/SpoT-type nucleotidyltranferase